MSVPILLFYEALNALRYSDVYNEEELASVARALSKYGFETWEPKGKLYEQMTKISLRHNISVYDASYIALALHLKAVFYTADLELTQKFPKNSTHRHYKNIQITSPNLEYAFVQQRNHNEKNNLKESL
jgi:predicted nucleic acid-binding protein